MIDVSTLLATDPNKVESLPTDKRNALTAKISKQRISMGLLHLIKLRKCLNQVILVQYKRSVKGITVSTRVRR